MATWIFQCNPDRYRIDDRLALAPTVMRWTVNQHVKRILPGDTVYIWRSGGKSKHEAGIVAEGRVVSQVAIRPELDDEVDFWVDPTEAVREGFTVDVQLVRIAEKGLHLHQSVLAAHAVLGQVKALTKPRHTNNALQEKIAGLLSFLWSERYVPLQSAEERQSDFESSTENLINSSLGDLKKRYANNPNKGPARKSKRVAIVYDRDPVVKALALRRANFLCELQNCQNSKFLTGMERNYCEVHHLVPLAEGGADTPENSVCLCANHHRELHFGQNRLKLRQILQTQRLNDD